METFHDDLIILCVFLLSKLFSDCSLVSYEVITVFVLHKKSNKNFHVMQLMNTAHYTEN